MPMLIRFIVFPARKPLPLGRGGSAASALVFYVPFDNFEWSPAARNGTVRRGPEMFSPEFLGDFGQGRRSKHPGRDALQGIDQGGESHLGRICDEKVSMVVLEPSLFEFALEVGTDSLPSFPEHIED